MAKRKYRKTTPEERARFRETEERILDRITREEGITREQGLAAIERLRKSG